ncbi:MAG TPA: glycosyltransferase [Phycisphaerales bacterium]|nr:glycosyltransferase [Phycisphaerales bacterium]
MAVGAALLVPSVVLLTETVAALFPIRRRTDKEPDKDADGRARVPRVVVLVPAHNEASQIVGTLTALARDLPARGSVLVVADNCTDETAALAAGLGVTVIERHDTARVGKGFAITAGLDHLTASAPEVVVILDADCRVSPDGIAMLAREAARRGRPIQAEYVLELPENPGPLSVVSALAVVVRNRVRPRGLDRLGLPCCLTGSGMAFPWSLLRAAPEAGENLVEDLAMGINLALQSYPPAFCPEVTVKSPLPESDRATLRQRRRWEHGQLSMLATQSPRLLAAGIARRQISLIALGLDVAVPPLALLVMLQAAWVVVTVLVHWLARTSVTAIALPLVALAQVVCAVALSWFKFGRQIIRLRQVSLVCFYLVKKIPIYAALALRGRTKRWERTPRKGEPSA